MAPTIPNLVAQATWRLGFSHQHIRLYTLQNSVHFGITICVVSASKYYKRAFQQLRHCSVCPKLYTNWITKNSEPFL